MNISHGFWFDCVFAFIVTRDPDGFTYLCMSVIQQTSLPHFWSGTLYPSVRSHCTCKGAAVVVRDIRPDSARTACRNVNEFIYLDSLSKNGKAN
jgi:hypothetical protein